MPLFDWDAAASDNVLKQCFWVFWALTVPLTAIVFGATGEFLVWRPRRDREEDIGARESINVAQ
ncbi:MAG: hypothetical protein M1833_000335 [Piccolia ochrophora]|nr:MAG: hypothetical protein M1833_000335 [Piccolia ochrophora]